MKTKKTIMLATAMSLFLGMSSCLEDIGVNGNGIESTETRWASSFDEVSSSGSFIVHVIPGDDYHIEVTAESNLQPYIVTDIDGDKLKIRTSGIHALHNHLPMEVFVTTPQLNKVSLSGSGYIYTGSYEGNHFSVNVSGSGQVESNVDVITLDAKISGSGKIRLNGFASETDMVVSGSGKILAYDLEQQFCNATISGSGNMYVNVENTIDASISGSGNVLFVNTPDVHSHISGSGKVINDN
ncbi:head GIN domain-containing protein [Sunxiuqinia sp. A32]|uniref:head GIN domain-containing protein n=1 Tax=Sunxiuqinia sp. A32 TaxID=3461496 RepID=UPI004045D0D2